jgi:LEA14-like dessication related protein
MSRLKFKQINSNIGYNTSTNVLTVSGSLQVKTDNPNTTSLAVSGAMYIVDNSNIVSASFNTSGSINVDIIDGGTY